MAKPVSELRPADLVRRASERALGEGRMTLDQARLLLGHYETSLRGTTYLTPEST